MDFSKHGMQMNHRVLSEEERAALTRVGPTMPLAEILTILAEYGVRTWHMACDGGQVLIFIGDDAKRLASQALTAVYK